MSKIPGSPMERINIQIDAESNARIAVEAQSEADGSPLRLRPRRQQIAGRRGIQRVGTARDKARS